MSGASFNVTTQPPFGRGDIQNGTVNVKGTKTVKIKFPSQFKQAPRISITLGNNSLSIPYKQAVNRNRLVIKFKTSYTGEIDWIAQERTLNENT